MPYTNFNPNPNPPVCASAAGRDHVHAGRRALAVARGIRPAQHEHFEAVRPRYISQRHPVSSHMGAEIILSLLLQKLLREKSMGPGVHVAA